MSEPRGSLLVLARRLRAVARSKEENESDSQAEGQVATALNKLNRQLLTLSAVVESYAVLRDADIAIAPPPDLKAPVRALKSQVDGIGRPSPQFLTKRTVDIGRNVTDLQFAVEAAWTTWANGQIDALDGDELSGHPPRLAEIQAQIVGLRTTAKQRFSSATFRIFGLELSRVRESIEELQTPTDLEKVVERIKKGAVALADLTESEVIGLRADPTFAQAISVSLL